MKRIQYPISGLVHSKLNYLEDLLLKKLHPPVTHPVHRELKPAACMLLDPPQI